MASVVAASPAMAQVAPGTGPDSGSFPILPPQVKVVSAVADVTEVTVERGNTLSGLAERYCHDTGDWTGWYVKNKRTIGGDPNVIQVGQRLAPGCYERHVSLPAAAPSYREVSYNTPEYPAEGSGYGDVNASDFGGIESCIIERESGGNSQVMNASGHYGLFQFDAGTWASGGGSPGDFGHASVAEQEHVFAAVYAARGAEPWAPSDGC